MFGIMLGAWTIKKIGVSRINWIYRKPLPEINKSICESDS